MIAAIELALLEQLRAMGGTGPGTFGYTYQVLETFPDEFEEYLVSVRNLRTPAAWASWLGFSEGEDQGGDDGLTAVCRFVLVVAASNLRNEQDSRHGDGAVPGSFQLVEDAVRVLSENWLNPLTLVRPVSIRSARPIARSAQMKTQKLSLIAIELECTASFGTFDAELGDFRTLHADWDVPPHGNVVPPLPAENPDAEDLIQVPQ